jgi:hypothetical protein
MSKLTLTGFMLPLLLFASPDANSNNSAPRKQTILESRGQSGTLQKMIVENGTVSMDLDVDRLNADGSLVAKVEQLRFAVAANSFFSILVFNDLLRGPLPGSMALVPQNVPSLPASLGASLKQLVVEKLPSGQGSDLAVRDGNTGFTFFNIEGHQYDYDAAAQSLAITNGRLLVSKEFANALGRPSDAGAAVGKISIGAAMQPIQIDQLVNGEPKSMVMPPMQHAVGPENPTLVPGPDVIVGDIESVEQPQGGVNGNFVGLGVGTVSCNNGDQPIDWHELPDVTHPVIPQNLYRMSGGADNTERFEQIGQSWMKHAFFALEEFICGTCNTSPPCVTGDQLCPGCADTYVASLNYNQNGIGSRAWVNPFSGSFPSNSNSHSGHNHTGTSHRVTVATSDLIPAQNPGATYFAEGQYISPTEYTWCQLHPGQCNMYNNVSYRQFTVSGGPSTFTFSPVGSTFRMQPAMMAWTGATVNQVQPDPGNDGIFFVGYKVTNPSPNIWHYEYAIYNENLDRSIQSFEVVYPLFPAILNNVGFHAPPQEPGWANDGTFNNQGYSSTPWTFTKGFSSATWNCETFAQNQNANAIRFGTLYNFRFDSSAPPAASTANIGFFKTGSPISVDIPAPAQSDTTPTPTPTATPTPKPTATATPTPTPTSTPRPTPTPRSSPPPRPRPTPPPRP